MLRYVTLHSFTTLTKLNKNYTSIKPKSLTSKIFIAILFVKSTEKKKKRERLNMASNNKLSRESAPKYRQEYLAQNIRLREVFYICTDVQLYSTSPYLHPHPIISPLTLPSVQRNNVLQWVHPFLNFFKIWKIMQMIWKINKKFEIWQKKKNKTNKQTKKKNINNDDDKKKIHHRIHRDKGNTMIKKICLTLKNRKKWGGRTKPLGHLQEY